MLEPLTRARHAAGAGRLEADEIIEGILRAAPQQAGAWLLRSQIALQFQQFERSLESAARAVQFAPADGAGWYALGRACTAAGDLERAIHCYQKSLEVGPADPDVLTSLGIAMRAVGRAREAIAAYRQALTIAPDHTIAHHNLANALEALGESAQEALFHRSAGRPGLLGGIEIDSHGGLDRAHTQLAALELDVLFYQDIGMESVSYFLSFARLAPVQCVSFGHPNTTGVPNMDYFISNDLYETAESPGHYSERLFLLRGLATLAYYYRPAAPAGRRNRSYFRLPQAGTLYLCPQLRERGIRIDPD